MKEIAETLEALRQAEAELIAASSRSQTAMLRMPENFKIPESEEGRARLRETARHTSTAATLAITLASQAQIKAMSILASIKYEEFLLEHPQFEENLQNKKETVSDLNQFARSIGATFKNTIDFASEYNTLVVVTSRDGKGRYAFESKTTKKRSGAFKSIREIMPFKMQIVPPLEREDDPTAAM